MIMTLQTCSVRYTAWFDFRSKGSQIGCGYLPRLVNFLSSKLGRTNLVVPALTQGCLAIVDLVKIRFPSEAALCKSFFPLLVY